MRVINRFRLITNQIKARHSKTLYSSILSIIMGSHNNSEGNVIILIREQRKCREMKKDFFSFGLRTIILPLINNLIQHIFLLHKHQRTRFVSDNDSENKKKVWRSIEDHETLEVFLRFHSSQKLFFFGWLN